MTLNNLKLSRTNCEQKTGHKPSYSVSDPCKMQACCSKWQQTVCPNPCYNKKSSSYL